MTDDSAIRRAAVALARGGAVVYPTETLYGLGVDAASEAALGRLVELKGREPGKPISILVGSRGMLDDWVGRVPPYAERIMAKLWPGAVTIALPAKPHVSGILTGGGGTIGVRVSSHPTAGRLVSLLGRAVTAPSANPAGLAPARDVVEARRYYAERVEVYLDGGRLADGPGSTVIDASADRPLLVREGAVPAPAIEDVAGVALLRRESGSRSGS